MFNIDNKVNRSNFFKDINTKDVGINAVMLDIALIVGAFFIPFIGFIYCVSAGEKEHKRVVLAFISSMVGIIVWIIFALVYFTTVKDFQFFQEFIDFNLG